MSHAKTSASPAAVPESVEPARVFGPRCSESLASYDPATSSLRTCQLSLLEAEPELLQTLPPSGMTRSGTVYRLRSLGRRTFATAGGAWPTPDASVSNLDETLESFYARREGLKAKKINGNGAGVPLAIAVRAGEDYRERIPTPTGKDCDSSGGRNKSAAKPDSRTHPGTSLTDYVRADQPSAPRLWPTPEASDGSGGRVSREVGGTRPSGSKRAVTLGTAVAHAEREMWPTPRASDDKRGPDLGRTKNGDDLATAVHRRLPTPNARDHKGAPGKPSQDRGGREWSLPTAVKESDGSGSLNPEFVEGLMGFPRGWTEV